MNKIVEPVVYVAVFSALAYYAYRMIKSGLEPPPEEYVPDGIEAELYMDNNPDRYPDFQMSWDG
jgi:hypothetical protein